MASIVINFLQIVAEFGDIIGAVVGVIVSLLSLVLSLGGLILWVYLIVQTYQGKNPRIPVAAGVADDLV